MKVVQDNPTGWMAFVAAYRAEHPTAAIDFKVLMQLYIRGRAPIPSENKS